MPLAVVTSTCTKKSVSAAKPPDVDLRDAVGVAAPDRGADDDRAQRAGEHDGTLIVGEHVNRGIEDGLVGHAHHGRRPVSSRR